MDNLTHIDGMKYCLEIIQKVRKDYALMGFTHDIIERVLRDVENQIGMRAYREWEIK